MLDFEERIRFRSCLDRIPLIKALIDDEKHALWVVDQGKKAKGRGAAGQKAEEARAQIPKFGRIIYFLRFRSLASGTTEAEKALCEMLAQKLHTKGQWEGEYSV